MVMVVVMMLFPMVAEGFMLKVVVMEVTMAEIWMISLLNFLIAV